MFGTKRRTHAGHTLNYRRPLLRDRLAAEYVLGTLHGGARARFEQLLRDDFELGDRVAFWTRHLMPMASVLSTAAPSRRVWDGIAARIITSERIPAQNERTALWRFLKLFDVRTLGTVTAGLLLGIALTVLAPSFMRDAGIGPLVAKSENQLPESYVGVLATPEGRTGLIVSSLRHGKVMDVKRVLPVPVAEGKTLFLWVIEGKDKIRPIGAIPAGAFVNVGLPQTSEKLFAAATELAVSVEPINLAPLQPSGAFVYRGLCGKLWRVPVK
jgi:anti-sigma-K factor RskA